jgi:Zn finger protein HypA/HybF involved in hydrogenase expression
MKFKRNTIKIGNSVGIIIPKVIIDTLDIKDKDEIVVNITKVNEEKIPTRCRCKLCGLLFESDDDIPYCPACDCEEVETMYEGIEIEGGHKYNGNISTSREH